MSFRLVVVAWCVGVALSGCTCGEERIRPVETVDAGPDCVPVPETCNGLDDDCDAKIDEELAPISCGVGACAREVPSCVGGAPFTCTPLPASAETCNGVDDDCNGTVDDGLMPAACGVGECAAVGATCVDGRQAACAPGTPGAEQCNGLDDDCDGTVDEGLVTNTSGDLRITNNAASSDYVYLGRGSGGFGMVWQDKRDGANGQIYYAGLSSTGTRQGGDVRVSNTANPSTHPAISWNGQTWGLVYADGAAGSLELYYRPLAANGQPGGAAVRLTTASGDSDWPDLVWAGTSYALAWEDSRAGAGKQDLYFERFDLSGVRLGGEVRVTTDPGRQSSPILKWNGAQFGLVWTDYRNAGNREIYFRRLAEDGSPLGGEVRVTNDGADSAWPDLAWNDADREWAVVWHDGRDGNPEVYFARLSEAGVKRGNDVRLTSAAGFSGYASIDWNGFQYGVSWQDDRVGGKPAIYFSPVSSAGVKASELKLSSGSGTSSFTTALWNGSTFAFGWRDDRDGNTELYFALVGCAP